MTLVPADARGVSDVRIENTMTILETLRRARGLTTHMICEATGLTPPTVTSILRFLEKSGWVTQGERIATGGRKAQSYSLDPNHLQCIAVDLQVHQLKGAVIDIAGTVHEQLTWRAQYPERPFPEQLGEMVEALVQRLASRGAKPVAIGISLPAYYDEEGDRVTFAPNIGGEGLALAGPLSGKHRIPVAVENDARAGALAELWWNGEPGRTLAYIVADYGVGAGIAIGGEVHRGRLAAAGDIGHAVIDPTGQPCRCGQIGCLETFVSFPAISRRLAQLNVPQGRYKTIDDIVDAALAGDERVQKALSEAAQYLAVAASILRITLDPDEIVLGGALSRAGDLVLDPMIRVLSQVGPDLFRTNPPRLRVAAHAGESGLFGAAALAFRRFFNVSLGRARSLLPGDAGLLS